MPIESLAERMGPSATQNDAYRMKMDLMLYHGACAEECHRMAAQTSDIAIVARWLHLAEQHEYLAAMASAE